MFFAEEEQRDARVSPFLVDKNKNPLKQHRICQKKDFEQLKTDAFKFRGRSLIVYYRVTQESFYRCAFSLSRKKFNAVERNRLKRVLREYLRKNLKKETPVDFLMIVLNNQEELLQSELQKYLEKIQK